MSHIMPAESGNPNPTDQLYPVTEAAELLLGRSNLYARYTPADAKRALRAAAEADEVPVLRIDGRLAFSYGELVMHATIDAFVARMVKAGESRG
ncbi:hypothetical protein [Streptomyces sp. NPDC086989]|uniref:hypothetical protein n=1 Tax=Streptomyces sp. NPDC086989 TaxID=3365764 RepID=UPI0037FBB6C2